MMKNVVVGLPPTKEYINGIFLAVHGAGRGKETTVLFLDCTTIE
jgi:hypothetical protein